MRYVVDASVAVKWLLPEDHTEQAEGLLVEGNILAAPDLLYSEVGSALWKRVKRREITQEKGREALVRLAEIEIVVTPTGLLLDRAFDLACEHGRTVYDCIYLALALAENAILVTGDKRFCNSMLRTPHGESVMWVGGLAVKRGRM
jgi:predicted nucleic acid-binding protein